MEYTALFDLKGNWLETEQEMEKDEAPLVITTIIKIEFPEFSIEEIEFLENSEGKFYELEIENGKNKFEITFNNVGEIVNK